MEPAQPDIEKTLLLNTVTYILRYRSQTNRKKKKKSAPGCDAPRIWFAKAQSSTPFTKQTVLPGVLYTSTAPAVVHKKMSFCQVYPVLPQKKQALPQGAPVFRFSFTRKYTWKKELVRRMCPFFVLDLLGTHHPVYNYR